MKTKKIALFLALILCISVFAGCSNASEAETLERGTVDSGKYTSTSLGITFQAPEGWIYMNDEEIAANYGAASEEFDIQEANVVYDMLAYSPEGSSININFENMGKIYGKVIDEASYIEISKEKITEAFVDAGYTCEFGESSTETLGGKSFDCLNITIGYGEISMYEKLFLKKVGDFMGIITITQPNNSDFSTILSCFA